MSTNFVSPFNPAAGFGATTHLSAPGVFTEFATHAGGFSLTNREFPVAQQSPVQFVPAQQSLPLGAGLNTSTMNGVDTLSAFNNGLFTNVSSNTPQTLENNPFVLNTLFGQGLNPIAASTLGVTGGLFNPMMPTSSALAPPVVSPTSGEDPQLIGALSAMMQLVMGLIGGLVSNVAQQQQQEQFSTLIGSIVEEELANAGVALEDEVLDAGTVTAL